MLLGVYMMMLLLSPWAEKVTEKELKGWLWVWAITSIFPFLRKACAYLCGEPSFGAVPYLYGECSWNSFGMFHYISGFVGYVLLGFWFRKFASELSWKKTLMYALPLWVIGFAIVSGVFWLRIPFDGSFPLVRPYATAVDLEVSWEFCSLGVVMTSAAYFMVLRKLTSEGAFYKWVIRPFSEASYGTYLVHIFFLIAVMPYLKDVVITLVAIILCAMVVFICSSLTSLFLRRIPLIGRFLG